MDDEADWYWVVSDYLETIVTALRVSDNATYPENINNEWVQLGTDGYSVNPTVTLECVENGK